MSTQRGSGLTRNRAQKHKNSFAFKNDLHDKTPQMKKINQLNVCEVWERCKAQIEWKIKYKKYKPLSQAKTCIKCGNRTVKKAYHVACKDCSKKEKICAKCLKSAAEVAIEPPEPTPEEQLQLKVEMDRLIKSLPERKRRTFMRFMKKGKEVENNEDEDAGDLKNESEVKETIRIPHSRTDLMNKFESLKVAQGEEEDDDEDNSDFEDDDSFNDELFL